MILLRRANERHHAVSHRRECWTTFNDADRSDPLSDGFGLLARLDEYHLPPGTTLNLRVGHPFDILTYAREGSLASRDGSGHSKLITAGEFRRVTTESSSRVREANASRSSWAHLYQLWLRPGADLTPGSYEARRFSTALRRGGLCAIACHTPTTGVLKLSGDAIVYSAVLEPGQHVAHEITAGRSAWVHIVQGQVVMDDLVLTTGDGAAVSRERAVSLTARLPVELFVVDLGGEPHRATNQTEISYE